MKNKNLASLIAFSMTAIALSGCGVGLNDGSDLKLSAPSTVRAASAKTEAFKDFTAQCKVVNAPECELVGTSDGYLTGNRIYIAFHALGDIPFAASSIDQLPKVMVDSIAVNGKPVSDSATITALTDAIEKAEARGNIFPQQSITGVGFRCWLAIRLVEALR